MLKVRPCWIMPGSADSCCATVWSRSTRPQGEHFWRMSSSSLGDFGNTGDTVYKRTSKRKWKKFESNNVLVGIHLRLDRGFIFWFKEVTAVRVQFHMQMHAACASTTNRNEMLFHILSVCEMGDSKTLESYY